MEDEGLPFLTWRARPDMACEHVNRAWLEFTGYSAAQALGDGWSRALHPEDLARWLDSCVRAFDARAPFAIEYRLRRHDGEYRWMLDHAAPRHTDDGLFVGFAGACVDIEGWRREHEALTCALELARSVLCELQPPARAIATWAAYLRGQTAPGSDLGRALDGIEREARIQDRLIDDLGPLLATDLLLFQPWRDR